MSLSLDRVEIESVGSDPVRLAGALLDQLPVLDGAVPIHEIALALDILDIREAPLSGLEACLQTDHHKSYGQVVLNAASSPRRQRFSIAHELGHFLNERHGPTHEGAFACSRDDMSAPFGDPRHRRQEQEANSFAIELLAPLSRLGPYLRPVAELDHALAISDRFDISREAAVRRYVELHRDCLAAVFTRHGQVRYIEKGEGFPRVNFWVGDDLGPALRLPAPDAEGLTELDEADPHIWLTSPGRHDLFVQTLH